MPRSKTKNTCYTRNVFYQPQRSKYRLHVSEWSLDFLVKENMLTLSYYNVINDRFIRVSELCHEFDVNTKLNVTYNCFICCCASDHWRRCSEFD